MGEPHWLASGSLDYSTMHYYTSALLLGVLVACTGGSILRDSRTSECFPGFYQCDTGVCIPESNLCDGVLNCVTGDDEMNCETSESSQKVEECFPGYYMCDTGTCIPGSFVCNGVANCITGDDEMNCAPTGNNTSEVHVECSAFSYECAGGVCVPLDKVCDGVLNCIMGDDEENCKK
ncbi:low-density lipoprotein receptor class A domain-containing protein 3-like isoform X1 [Penaeus monodon]|uniref:low-density lipoprotein receptor class A domain-containing protein 3-like isoform X1 n=1 Tax=Penaeus monodon TaxID=6687 RepID=UPI0018A70D85|nr:low-density lipoprotein receptor class A domain-containing protein 3-like isoform X1 [Penaeus monodon]